MAALTWIPLGGTGEIGMNLNVYGYDGELLVVDCGVTFERETASSRPILPDPRWLVERRSQLVGLVLTHAHLDHLGAVADLWPELRCPVYATPFTAYLLEDKLREAGILRKVDLQVLPPGARFQVGSYDLQYLPLTHSTPESQALVLRVGRMTVLHTGDWKLDPDPLVGDPTRLAEFRRLGDEGVHAVVGDSTNATRPGRSSSEALARRALGRLVADWPKRVFISCFSSNVARVRSAVQVAAAARRQPVLLGRSLERVVGAARRAGYLRDVGGFVGGDEAAWLPPAHVLAIATGSQGEPLAALSRLAFSPRPRSLPVEEGDLVIFSAKIIPGNEGPISRLKDALAARGVVVKDELTDPDVHVSGHPAQAELEELYAAVRPRWVLPTHGEPRHLEAHGALAVSLGLGKLVARNGQVVRIGPGDPRFLGVVPTGRLVKDERKRRLYRLPPEKPANA